MQVLLLPPKEGGGRRDSIDPSAAFVQTKGGVGIVVDFGMAQERVWDIGSGASKELPVIPRFPPHPPHFLILTHGHIDHIGSALLLLQKYPNARLVTTRPTLEICRIQWIDLKKIAKINGYPGLVPFSHDFFREIEKSAIIIKEPGWTHLAGDISVCFIPNGHGIRGSASVFIEADQKIVGFSGDVSIQDTPLVKGMRRSDFEYLRGKRIDKFFIESTYGSRNIPLRKAETEKGLLAVIEAIGAGGKVLAGAFALGRAQEVLIDQASYMKSGQVYLDSPMATEYWHLFADKSRSFWSDHDVPIPEGLLVEEPKRRRIRHVSEAADPNLRARILKSSESYLLVATAGCFQAGHSVELAKEILKDPKSLVLLCNYQFDGTPGAALEKIERGGTVYFADGESVRVEAKVLRLENSGHAGADELVSIAKWANAIRTYTYHGTPFGGRNLRRLIGAAGLQVGNVNSHKGEPILV